ncbi:MAG TPA: Hsp20/alpha crystallin family protein [Solirubrobacterales bacterium]
MSRQRDLFVNFDRVRREMDELFGDVWGRTGLTARRESGFSPPLDVYYCNVEAGSEGEPKAIVKVDVSGVELAKISLEVSGRRLLIAGERPVQETEGRVYEQLEIARGPFRRAVELSADVDAERAAATYEDGILRIELPLVSEAARSRTVPIERGEQG